MWRTMAATAASRLRDLKDVTNLLPNLLALREVALRPQKWTKGDERGKPGTKGMEEEGPETERRRNSATINQRILILAARH